jgi:hypothetical protein
MHGEDERSKFLRLDGQPPAPTVDFSAGARPPVAGSQQAGASMNDILRADRVGVSVNQLPTG